MNMEKKDKLERVLSIYTKLMNGSVVSKAQEANRFGVNEKSIQRDIEDIRNYLETSAEDAGIDNTVIYDRLQKGYRLEQVYRMKLTNSEILAICKILLDSRAFTKFEMTDMLRKLIECCVPKDNQKLVNELIRNEAFHYIEPRHKTVFIDKMWEIGQAIQKQRYIEIKYQGIQGTTVKTRKLKPLAIMFSEYYFYLAAFIDDAKIHENFNVINDSFPTIYRIDRIQGLKVLAERYELPYANRFEEGEFRRRVQFMYGGQLRKVTLQCNKKSLEAVLDRFPTSKIISQDGEEYVVQAEVFGDGVDMWLKSQDGNNIQIQKEKLV